MKRDSDKTRTMERNGNIIGTSESELKLQRNLAIKACKDFMDYGVAGYTQELIDKISSATTEREIRELLRKARAAS